MSTERAYRKKLIEVSMPLEAINAASNREKNTRHGHPSTMHLWWARRPLAACRAVLFGQLVDDPSSWPEKFRSKEAQEQERKRLFHIIEQLVQWENSTNEKVLNDARYEIARSIAWNLSEEPPKKETQAILDYLQTKAPPVYDPFSGGGSIPLEAQRLGLRAYGSDLNPVAVLIGKALIEIPPKFFDNPPINPQADKLRHYKGTEGLVEDVRYYGLWVRQQAMQKIGHLYPQAEVTEEAVRQQPALKSFQGKKLTVIAWLWTRTVQSPNPACGGAHVPLTSNFMLSTKNGKKAWVEPKGNATNSYCFIVKSGNLSEDEEIKLKSGTKSARGANFTCILSGVPITAEYIKAKGKSGQIGVRLMAVVVESEYGRIYLPPDNDMEKIVLSESPSWEPEGALPENPRWFSPPDYGMPEYKDLFTKRQLVALTTFSDLAKAARARILSDAQKANLPDGETLINDGKGAVAYADAVATYLAFGVSRLADICNAFCRWEVTKTQVRNLFGRQAIPMVWDFAEPNIFSNSAGDFGVSLGNLIKVLERLPSKTAGKISQIDAMHHGALRSF